MTNMIFYTTFPLFKIENNYLFFGKNFNSEVKFKSMLGDAPYKSTKGVKRMSVSQADTDLFAVIPDTR